MVVLNLFYLDVGIIENLLKEIIETFLKEFKPEEPS
jgi:hypothetical protein